jgi:hypothetical protein
MAGLLRQKGKTMSATKLRYPQWQGSVLQVVMETRPGSLMRKIQSAENAISQRLRKLEGNPESKEERVALRDAVSTLQVLSG